MRLKGLKLRNFRGYKSETYIELNNLTAFVGKNDAGKSTILEALEIFFNNNIVKIDRYDLNVDALANGETNVEITCIFSELPKQLTIDAGNPTTFAQEYLLNNDNDLEVKKIYACTSAKPNEQVFIVANHPTVPNGNDLLLMKRTELRSRINDLGIPQASYNGTLNSSMRSAIWIHLGNLNLSRTDLQVDKEDAKKTWDFISKWMPQYALFKSDRESTDSDKEVTDPMKMAINMALAEVQNELNDVQKKVMEKAVDVANRTLAKLQEMNALLANQLKPNFKADPKWASLFNLSLASDKNISINKRGSGVRRLIVLNFFRAEAERRRNENNSQAIIYAFEEPENSQHPNHQTMLINAFIELADSDKTQVLVTTHSPALAGLIPKSDLRLIAMDDNGNIVVLDNPNHILKDIAVTLGMLPDPLQPKLLFCVEGPNDISFFKTISAMIHVERPDLPNLETDDRVAIFPLGGGTLKDWVNHDYLKGLGIPQFHLYDLDDSANPPYLNARDEVRARGGKNWAELTVKRETENYLHPVAIQNIYGFPVTFGDMDDVPEIVAMTQHTNSDAVSPWAELSIEKQKKKASNAKKRLNSVVTNNMTWAYLQVSDANGDIVGWLEAIRDRLD
jgi:energy-coupling factor transporter ATP-binding protein EcfA2